MIVLTTIVNLLGVRIISRVNNIGVIAELIGAVGLILLLIINIKHGPSVLFETDGTGAGHDWGYFGALLLGAIMPLYVMYGFDSAGSLAEETADPRRTAPRALIRALLTAGVLGFLLIGFGTMAVDEEATGFGLTSITKDVLGETWGNIWLADVAIAIFVCCLAIQAMSIRILFSMARDGNLPFARAIASVSAQRRVPVVPALASGAIALIILAFNIVNPSAFTIIVALGIILMYIAYLGVTIPLLRKRQAGWPGNLPDAKEGLFALGAWGIPVNVFAILYGASMIINLEWPRTALYVDDTYKWGPIVATIAARRLRARSTTTPSSGTRARCSRSTAPRSRRATDRAGRAGDVPARPALTVMDEPFKELARRDAKAIRGGMALTGIALVIGVAGLFLGALVGFFAMLAAGLVQLNVLYAWLIGPRFMAERRPVLMPGVLAGVPFAMGAYALFGGVGGDRRLAAGRGARHRHRRDDGRGTAHLTA